ncbi:UDP-glucosyltransferase 2-like [Leptidea sinapis]|uniref:UDP-glucosyltransferase 2-like n=1 Tax=Leptidea sinapis TaxID=189913 RepID=UPI0021C331AB|nr:UDP-glucosyltransferase 2-like [Leptidea sinapis]
MFGTVHLLVVFVLITISEAARILAVFPVPSYSHQITFRPLTQELARRGHHVTVATYMPTNKTMENLKEIDLHDSVNELLYVLMQVYVLYCISNIKVIFNRIELDIIFVIMVGTVHLLVVFVLISISEAARILAVFPAPSYSHQITFRPLIQELAIRGHHVTYVTFMPPNNTMEYLKVIDIHDSSYELVKDVLVDELKHADDIFLQNTIIFKLFAPIFDKLLQNELRDYTTDKYHKFDVILSEACVRMLLMFSHVFKAPVVQVSSFGGSFGNYEMIGAAKHPLLHPLPMREKFHDLSTIDKVNSVYSHYKENVIIYGLEERENEIIRKHLGEDFRTLSEMHQNVALVLLNTHPIWDLIRPVPSNLVYLGGLHLQKENPLPHDLQSELESSRGIIYMSFGTVVNSEILPTDKLRMFLKVLGELPYDVYWKWTGDVGTVPSNVRVRQWFPQADLLRHEKVMLFITQGGLQSIDESIEARVPMLCIPIMWDQWYNAARISKLNIGVQMNIREVTEKQFKEGILNIMQNKSYRENVIKLRDLYNDKPLTSLETAVWWIEHVIRHKGGKHLRSAAFNMAATDYYETNLVLFMFVILLPSVVVLYLSLIFVIGFLRSSKIKKE